MDTSIIAGWPGPRRVDFDTTDLEQAGGFLRDAFGGRLLAVGALGGQAPAVAIHHVDAGPVTSSDLTLTGDLDFAMRGSAQVVVSDLLGGRLIADRDTGRDKYQSGDVLMSNFPQADYQLHTQDLHVHKVTLPMPLLYAVADGDAPLRFVSAEPVSGVAARQWKRTGEFVDGVLDDPDAASSPLVVGNAARVLAATALSVFPNTAVTGPAVQDRRDATPVTLQLAIAFIEDHAQDHITAAGIAAAASVTIRAVQLAFQEHLDTTPTAYLRRVRLGRAHRELLNADPRRVSVGAVAHRWGFSTPARFTTAYREAYGVTPGEILQQR
jgi:AraC-like DNA-binding protein